VKAHLERGISLAPGKEIGYVVRDAGRWVVDIERDASGFDIEYYEKLLEKAWQEVAFVLECSVFNRDDPYIYSELL
jgi:hypothetical protein